MELSTEPTITVSAVNVAAEQARAVAFIALEIAAVSRLTGWRRAGLLGIVGLNIFRMGRTFESVHRVVLEERARAAGVPS